MAVEVAVVVVVVVLSVVVVLVVECLEQELMVVVQGLNYVSSCQFRSGFWIRGRSLGRGSG